MAKKAKGTRKRYTPQQKQQILAAAKKEGLTGAQVKKRFGVSTLTFYRWRGPVRKKRGKRGPGRPKGSKNRVAAGTGIGNGRATEAAVRKAVQAQIRSMLPRVIADEVARALKG